MHIKRGENDEHAVIRFPWRGNVYGPWREEKVRNEVMVMEYLREHTSIPAVPRVPSWGVSKECPQQLDHLLSWIMSPGRI